MFHALGIENTWKEWSSNTACVRWKKEPHWQTTAEFWQNNAWFKNSSEMIKRSICHPLVYIMNAKTGITVWHLSNLIEMKRRISPLVCFKSKVTNLINRMFNTGSNTRIKNLELHYFFLQIMFAWSMNLINFSDSVCSRNGHSYIKKWYWTIFKIEKWAFSCWL